mmetsp:Transcript_9529/g.13510  ORF Transcript_9529/g.13510 Transcript_9529/m.13510 type:complete len:92 (+) Transcript_9529:1447-1722(+)
MCGWPSNKTLCSAIDNGLIVNCPFHGIDLDNGLEMYGPQQEILMGKATRHKLNSSAIPLVLAIPPHTFRKVQNEELDIDHYKVNDIPFLYT